MLIGWEIWPSRSRVVYMPKEITLKNLLLWKYRTDFQLCRHVPWLTLYEITSSHVDWLTLYEITSSHVDWLTLYEITSSYVDWLTLYEITSSYVDWWKNNGLQGAELFCLIWLQWKLVLLEWTFSRFIQAKLIFQKTCTPGAVFLWLSTID